MVARTPSGAVSAAGRRNAKAHLPGTDKFPISGPGDVRNAKRDIGRTNEPRSKVVAYIDREARKYGVAPVGGDKEARTSHKVFHQK